MSRTSCMESILELMWTAIHCNLYAKVYGSLGFINKIINNYLLEDKELVYNGELI